MPARRCLARLRRQLGERGYGLAPHAGVLLAERREGERSSTKEESPPSNTGSYNAGGTKTPETGAGAVEVENPSSWK